MANAVQGTTNFDIDVALLDTRSNYSWITPVTTYHWSSSSEPMPQSTKKPPLSFIVIISILMLPARFSLSYRS